MREAASAETIRGERSRNLEKEPCPAPTPREPPRQENTEVIVAAWGEDLAVATRDENGQATPQAYLYGHDAGRDQHDQVLNLVAAPNGATGVVTVEVDEAGMIEAYPDGEDTFETLSRELSRPSRTGPAGSG